MSNRKTKLERASTKRSGKAVKSPVCLADVRPGKSGPKAKLSKERTSEGKLIIERLSRKPLKRKFIWGEEHLALLGTMTDEQLAKELGNGLAKHDVFAKRKQYGIAPRRKWGTRYPSWKEEDLAKLGTMTDGELAEKLGLTRQAVQMARTKLKIPAYRKHS